MYDIPEATKHDPSNMMGMFENGDVYVQSDLDSFFAAYSPNIPKGTKPVLKSINGAQAPGTNGSAEGEADLDIEIALPLIYPQAMQVYQVDTSYSDDIYDTFLDALDGSYCKYKGGDNKTIDGKTPHEQCGAYKPANVISFSYGTAEADYPAAYLERQCHEFMKLGLQGTTMLMASGDDGVARRTGPCLGPKQNIFTPSTAADCPYLTAVGATILPAGGKPGDAEHATIEFSSGGGFSNVFTSPSYQTDAVES
jgi:tripeptidyl-peptidase-1